MYRTDYGTEESTFQFTRAFSEMLTSTTGSSASAILAAGLENPETAARLQQLCGAVTAKAVEDTWFYRAARLVSLNEVGGEPALFGMSVNEFHERAKRRARDWPSAMITLSTHDTKRGEDVRARITVLSQVAGPWAQRMVRWNRVCLPPDEATGLFLWQNIVGVWPLSGEVGDAERARLHAFTEKAIREAAVHTTWIDPDHEFEESVHAWLDALIDGPIATEITALVQHLDSAARSDALAQKLLALTVPGVPDIYQGTELWDDSLVDPDNRRPVDFALRRTELDALAHRKIRVVAAALQSRREHPDMYLSGGYTPVFADGAAAEHVIAYRRGDDVLVAIQRWTLRLGEKGWGETQLTLPQGDWIDRLTGRTLSGSVSVAALFAELPGVLLEKARA
jgi:(1->4)-alpha-D-glucan 1-alpha-D-glucosylmutase